MLFFSNTKKIFYYFYVYALRLIFLNYVNICEKFGIQQQKKTLENSRDATFRQVKNSYMNKNYSNLTPKKKIVYNDKTL